MVVLGRLHNVMPAAATASQRPTAAVLKTHAVDSHGPSGWGAQLTDAPCLADLLSEEPSFFCVNFVK